MTATVGESNAASIREERVYDGPVDDLWQLWTTKEGLSEWFGPEGIDVEVTELELCVGGSFVHVGTAVGASEIAYVESAGRSRSTRVSGRFVEIVYHQRLRIEFSVDFLPGVEPYPYVMAVEFRPEGQQVRMIVTADRHPDAEMTRLAQLGLSSQLRRFDRALARREKEQQA
jgi:uncharacterized protein YndB with AHSA1/START domain